MTQEALELRPCTISAAKAFVRKKHRHHKKPPPSGLFALSVAARGRVVGVAIVGRPSARALQDGWTVEVTRVCTNGTPNACSFLYGAANRARRTLGWARCVTYTLASEPGTSLRAAGWKPVATVRARGWSCASRLRGPSQVLAMKTRWEAP